MQQSKVSIIGGGIAGLSLALILADHDVNVTIIEKNSFPDPKSIKPSARTTALMQGSLKILERAHIWPEFKTHCTPLSQLSIIDDSAYPHGSDSMIREDFKAEELGLSEFGYNIPLNLLIAMMADKVRKRAHITLLENTSIDHNDPVITDADLIVGADGRNSVVRGWAGIEDTRKNYGQSAITCLIGHAVPHHRTSIEFHRPGGPCTFVPCGDHQSAVVWVEKMQDADHFMALPKPDFINALQERSRGLLGDINLISEPESWPLMTLKSKRLVAPKTVLIAEAAHVLSPIGAQGLNLSLRDVEDLANVIIEAIKNGDDIGSITTLKSYEQKRRGDILLRYHGVDTFNQIITNQNPAVKYARRIGLRGLRHIGFLRKIVMTQGLFPR